MKKHVTQADIARLANVTRQTVSLVVNEDPRVNEETRKRILKIMEDLDYHPNVTARNLAARQSKTIGYHFFDLERDSFAQPLFAQSLAGIYFRANELGYTIKLFRLEPDQDYQSPYRRGEIDGAIFVTYDKAAVEERLVPLVDKGFPLVIIGSHPDIPHVSIDHASGARMAVEHLINKGCKKLAYLGGGMDFESNRVKYESFKATLAAHGLSEVDGGTLHTRYKDEHGYESINQLVKQGVQFDAVFSAANDVVAIGACRALLENRFAIPESVAVMGYDNSVYAQFCIPPLSTVNSPFFEFGQTAVDMVVNFINEDERPDSISLEPELVIRDSA